MIEVYSFLAAFTLQILAVSVLLPRRFARHIRTEMTRVPAKRLAGVYPGIDVSHAYDRYLYRYLAANMVVAVLGLLLLAWFYGYMRRSNWDGGRISGGVTAYFMLQYVPLMVFAWITVRFNKAHGRSLPEPKRTAVLQRRGLFDFVSPSVAVLAILSFLQHVVLVLYVARHPFPGFAGPFINIGIVSLMYVMFGIVMYWVMYGRKKGPLETNATRLQVTRAVVNSYAWMCVLVPLFVSFTLARKLLDLDAWIPCGQSLAFLLMSLFMLRIPSLSTTPGQAESELDSSMAR